MKKAMLFAAALGLLAVPALAQQSPSGSSAGGPARVGGPGQVGGGVPGTRPGVGAPDRMMPRRMMRKKMMRKRMMKRRMKRM